MENLVLKDLQRIIDRVVAELPEYQKAENISVIVNLDESSVGARAGTPIIQASMGFDWEYGQFRIQPKESLVRESRTRDDEKARISEDICGKLTYWCSLCENKVAKDDKYCRHCGQRLSRSTR